MANKMNDAKHVAKEEARKATKSSALVSKRLEVSKDLKLRVGKLQDELAEESHVQESPERMRTIRM